MDEFFFQQYRQLLAPLEQWGLSIEVATVLMIGLAILGALVPRALRNKRQDWRDDQFNRRQNYRRAEDNYPTTQELSKLDQTMPAKKLEPPKDT